MLWLYVLTIRAYRQRFVKLSVLFSCSLVVIIAFSIMLALHNKNISGGYFGPPRAADFKGPLLNVKFLMLAIEQQFCFIVKANNAWGILLVLTQLLIAIGVWSKWKAEARYQYISLEGSSIWMHGGISYLLFVVTIRFLYTTIILIIDYCYPELYLL